MASIEPTLVVKTDSAFKTSLVRLPTKLDDLTALNLAITSHLIDIIKLINEEPLTLVDSPTGTGKSLGIPWALSRLGFRVVVSVPTITAAENLAKRQRLINPQIKVGFAAESRIHYDQDSQIIYATSGHVRRRFLDYYRLQQTNQLADSIITGLIAATDIIILDEVHQGSIDDTINYSLWINGRQRQLLLPNMVLLSATPQESKYPTARRYSIKIQHYPVNVFWHNRNYRPGDKQLINDTINVIETFHNSLNIKGDMLVFMSGKNEVNTTVNKLNQVLTKNKPLILPAYGGMPIEELNKIYQQLGFLRETGEKAADAPRKIIIATNLLETSITVKGITVIIDSLTEKIAETSATGGLRLTLGNISQSSAAQRKGRAGRTEPGICYRMMLPSYFSQLKKNRVDEILRVPIYNTVMELLEVGLNPEDILTVLPAETIELAVKLLIKLKLVDEDRRVTEIGHFVTHFPLGVRNATILWKWIQARYPLFPGLVIIALLESYNPSYFFYPFQSPSQTNSEYGLFREEHRRKYFVRFTGYSDLATLLNMWNDFTASVGGPKADARLIRDWAVVNSINHRKLKEAIKLIFQLTGILRSKFKAKVEEGKFTTEGVLAAFRPLAAEIYDDLIMFKTGSTQGEYYHSQTKQIFRLDTYEAVNNLSERYPYSIIPFITFESQSSTAKINVALDFEIDRPIVSTAPSTDLFKALADIEEFFS